MDDDANTQNISTRDDALDQLGADLGVVSDRTGKILAVTGPATVAFSGAV